MSPGRAWAASGRRPARSTGRAPRPADSFSVAVARARAWWDDLAGVPPGRWYSEAATAAILSTAVALWPDVAASLAEDREG